ncbi:MAG: alpha/beta fold hydrolase [Kiloniellales bacterium]|nr:alpha/beta fold hydrolase [Kiloniellales bacterium]
MPRVALSVAACLILAACESLLFYPTADLTGDPGRLGLSYQEMNIETADGLALDAWFLPAEAARDTGCTLLFLHGNAGNISTHLPIVTWLPAAGYGVLLFDYRGYGRSPGEPSLSGLRRDFDAALDALLAKDGMAPGDVVVFGQSLGGAVAVTALAASPHRHEVKALVIEGAPSNYREITQEKLAAFWPTWPLQWPLAQIMTDDFRPAEAIAEISPTPVLILHGQADRVVPPHHGEALFAAAGKPKTLWRLEGGRHIAALNEERHREALVRFLGRCDA